MFDEKTLDDLVRLRHALKAMSKSTNKALMMGTYEGTGDLMVKNYQRLHQKAVEMLPNDFFVESFALDVDESIVDDKQKVSQVQLMVNQLYSYIENLIKEEKPISPEIEEFLNLGGQLRDQIIHITRKTIKMAVSNLDIDLDDDECCSEAKKPKHKVKIKIQKEDEDSTEEPPPPVI